MTLLNYMSRMNSLLHEAETLIIVPPFGSIERPSLAAHVLQACARKAGFRVSILYANVLLASRIGAKNYAAICYAPTAAFAGERFFAKGAHDLPALGYFADKMLDISMILGESKSNLIDAPAPEEIAIGNATLRELEAVTITWAEEIASVVTRMPFKIIGCTTTFEQTNASLTLLKRIKELRPEIITIIGGANCEGEMAEGMASMTSDVDYIFSGESEDTFPQFLRDCLTKGASPAARIIDGKPCIDLDAIPPPDYTEFFEQRDYYLPNDQELIDETVLPYESSRGCWWGQKHHCTFCGLNGEGMAFREKSPEKVIGDLQTLISNYPARQIGMVDNIMPHTYFRTLVPALAGLFPTVDIFYEQKANLSLANVVALKRAGISSIQPGIEALCSSLLKLMDKGVQARQNISLLRYARAVGVDLHWNLLWGFPGDELSSYQQTLALIPLIHHFQPPKGMYHLSIDRFSPYFHSAQKYGITNLRPLASYSAVFPPHAEIEKLAYHFIADYECDSYRHQEIIKKIVEAVAVWRKCWATGNSSSATLRISSYGQFYILLDTRGLAGTERTQVLEREQAAVALTPRPFDGSEETLWALDQKLGVLVDSWYVPLATARPELLQEFEDEFRNQHLLPVREPLPVLNLGSNS